MSFSRRQRIAFSSSASVALFSIKRHCLQITWLAGNGSYHMSNGVVMETTVCSSQMTSRLLEAWTQTIYTAPDRGMFTAHYTHLDQTTTAVGTTNHCKGLGWRGWWGGQINPVSRRSANASVGGELSSTFIVHCHVEVHVQGNYCTFFF